MSTPAALVADDEAPIRDLLARALTLQGYAVLTAADGHAALELLERATARGEAPFVAILDVRMPGLTGFEVLRAYHAGPGPHAPVVLFTGDASAYERARTARVDGVLTKPGDLDELLELVAALAADWGDRAESLRPGGRFHPRWFGGWPARWCVWDTWEACPTRHVPLTKRRWARQLAHGLDHLQAVADQRRWLDHARRDAK